MSLRIFQQEAERIREAYLRRDAAGKASLYAWTNPDVLLAQYCFRSTVARALADQGMVELSAREILDVGCGSGAWLRLLLEWGASAERLHGVDLLLNRIDNARALAPHIDFRHSEGWPLPFNDRSMDLVSAHTVFSSIISPEARTELANEMKRVLRPHGTILIYDFRVSDPRNRDTIGIGKREMIRLFPKMKISMYTVTLAPPLHRPLAQISALAAYLVERCLPFLRTHAVYLLQE